MFGPWVLASAGLLEGRVLTSWPGTRDDMVNAGATWLDEEFVQDRNLITSRGPQDLVPFVKGMIGHFTQGASLREKTRAARESSPQRNHPPKLMEGAMKRMPKPSTRTMFILGAVAAGLYAAADRKGFDRLQKRLAKLAA